MYLSILFPELYIDKVKMPSREKTITCNCYYYYYVVECWSGRNTNFTMTADWRRGISVNIHKYCVAWVPPLPWESWALQFEVSGPNIIMTLPYKDPHLLDNPALHCTVCHWNKVGRKRSSVVLRSSGLLSDILDIRLFMAFRIIRQRKEARRLAKIDEIFQVNVWVSEISYRYMYNNSSRNEIANREESWAWIN